MRQRTFSMSDEDWRELGKEAARRGVSRSQLVRDQMLRVLGDAAGRGLELRVSRIERRLGLEAPGE